MNVEANTTKQRYRIQGQLTLKTKLHLGDGSTTRCADLEEDIRKAKKLAAVEAIQVSTVAKDANGKPYLPGSSLKGSLRSWLRQNLNLPERQLEVLFGSEKSDDANHESRSAGKLAFKNSYLQEPVKPKGNHNYWNAETATAVDVSVSIDPFTRTAKDKFLRHFEYVPAGLSFMVELEGMLFEQDVINLLIAFNGFNDASDPVSLGAFGKDGWGQASWTLNKIQTITANKITDWLSKESFAPAHYSSLYENLSKDKLKELKDAAVKVAEVNLKASLNLDIELFFSGPFLVNDAMLVTKNKAEEEQDISPNFIPLRDQAGQAYLPARSFRGAFKQQADRVYLTVVPKTKDAIHKPKRIKNSDFRRPEYSLLPPLDLFGQTGYKTTLNLSSFTQTYTPNDSPDPLAMMGVAASLMVNKQAGKDGEFTQEFVAIDRFTGGNAEGAKYKAKTVFAPSLKGSLQIDLTRLKNKASLGLLAHTLRDLVEGDISFGFGASIGYGHCTAKITKVETKNISEDHWLIENLVSEIQYQYGEEEQPTPETLNQDWTKAEDKVQTKYLGALVFMFRKANQEVNHG